MTEYFISYYVHGCPYEGDGTYKDGRLLVDSPDDEPPYTPKYCGKSACFFCDSFKSPKIQCPVKKRKKENLYSRCSIGDLSEEEFNHFKNESGIKSNRFTGVGYELVLQSKDQIPLASIKDRRDHDDLLEQFDRDAKRVAPYIFDYGDGCYSLYDCIGLADRIRKTRRHGSVFMLPIAPQPADVANSEPAPEPKVELDTEASAADEEDIADRVDQLLVEGKGRWVEQDVIVDKMVSDYPHRFQNKKSKAKKALRRSRETEKIRRWSKKDSTIGEDGAGNIFQRTGNPDNKQSLSYQYFLSDK